MVAPPVFDMMSPLSIDLAWSSPLSLVLTKWRAAHQPSGHNYSLWTENMVAPSTLVGVTGRTGISMLRYLFPYCSTWAFVASVSASIAVRWGHGAQRAHDARKIFVMGAPLKGWLWFTKMTECRLITIAHCGAYFFGTPQDAVPCAMIQPYDGCPPWRVTL